MAESNLVLLLSPDGKRIILRPEPGREIHTHQGIIRHDDLLAGPLGRQIFTHLGHPFYLLKPSLHDLIMHTRRQSQIVYPKESGYILLKMNIVAGSRVIEGGTGSGALTLALAQAVAPTGKVYSYDQREDMLAQARKNLETAGLLEYVEFKARDLATGFDELGVDALFLDVREPQDFVRQSKVALTPGGFFGALVPTTNQAGELIAALETNGFVDLELCEILLRHYKTVPQRIRPVDRMVAHTGYLIFARSLAE